MDILILREYALKCYLRISGYSLLKAATLFPKYFPLILKYYLEILDIEQQKMLLRLTTLAFFTDGIAALNSIVDLIKSEDVIKIKLNEFDQLVDLINLAQAEGELENPSTRKKLTEFLNLKFKELVTARKEFYTLALEKMLPILKFANYYGFLDIKAEADFLVNDYTECLNAANLYLKLTEREYVQEKD